MYVRQTVSFGAINIIKDFLLIALMESSTFEFIYFVHVIRCINIPPKHAEASELNSNSRQLKSSRTDVTAGTRTRLIIKFNS